MEEKLKAAAENLPLPSSDFLSVEERNKSGSATAFVRRRWIPVLLVILILLSGCTIAAATTEVNHSAWVDPIVHGWGTVKRELKKVDYELPKTLGNSPFSQAEHMYFCPPGTSWLGAILNPSYKPTIVTYANRVKNDTNYGEYKWAEEIELMFGSTLNQYCHQWWELEEDYQPWFMRQDNLLEGTGQRLEYEDNILYTGTLVGRWESHTFDLDGNKIYEYGETHTHHVLWVDPQKNVAACLESDDVDPDTLLEYAKSIIGLNKQAG